MSETTLTTDGMALAAELRAYWPPTQGTHPAPVRFRSSSIEQDITVAAVIERLCDAAARAETLEAQLTEVTRERDIARKSERQTEHERDRAEAALAPLRAVVEAFLAKWEQVKPAIDGAFVMGHVHGARYTGPTIGEEIEAMRRALPADPSAPTPSEMEPNTR